MPQEPLEEQPKSLVRAIGRWSLTALMVNIIIGAGIFGLPSTLAGLLGRFSPLAMALGGLAAGVVMACFSEVASYFTAAGGPYLYTRVAFGRFVGLQAGWMLWLTRLTAPAASANVFVLYLGEFWPHAKDPLPRLLVLSILIWGLAAVNIAGVREGARVSNVFTVAKLLPLLAVGIAGGIFLWTHPHAATPPTPAPGLSTWLKAGLLLVFAYGGFDAALIPVGEARNPKKDAAFGLVIALLTCMAIYTLMQWAVMGLVPGLAHSERPLADAARNIWGSAGATLVAIGALVSVLGNLSANTLAVPRITFALAEHGDFPSFFAAVHSRFRTPYVSILAFAVLTWAFALNGNFVWNVGLSAVARLFYYGACCAALPVLRRKMPGKAFFRMPGGPWLAGIGVILCATLFTQVDRSGSMILLATVAVAALNWLAVRGKHPPQDAF
jgi:APA family basic amino acid/polyamine antiporter